MNQINQRNKPCACAAEINSTNSWQRNLNCKSELRSSIPGNPSSIDFIALSISPQRIYRRTTAI